jgi:hypothetical protein
LEDESGEEQDFWEDLDDEEFSAGLTGLRGVRKQKHIDRFLTRRLTPFSTYSIVANLAET